MTVKATATCLSFAQKTINVSQKKTPIASDAKLARTRRHPVIVSSALLRCRYQMLLQMILKLEICLRVHQG